MRRGTTPTLKLKITGIDKDALKDVFVTVAQGSNKFTKSGDDVTYNEDEQVFNIRLTEEETLSFKPSAVSIQVRATTQDDEIVATNIRQVMMEDVLYDKPLFEESEEL